MRFLLKKILRKPTYFFVTSCGYSGSWWLASSLHMHPEIKCSMGHDASPASFNYDYNYSEVAKIFSSSYKWYKNGVLFKKYFLNLLDKLEENGSIAYKDKIQYQSIIPDSNTRASDKLLEFILEDLNKTTTIKYHAKYYGNVHGLSARQYAQSNENLTKYGFLKNKTVVFDLIRNPITRLDTCINYECQWYDTQMYGDEVKKSIDNLIEKNLDIILTLEKTKKIDFSITRNKVVFAREYLPDRSFLLSTYSDIVNAPHFTRIQFEKLHNDPDYFSKIFKMITNGLMPENDYLNKVFSSENANRGRAGAKDKQQDRSNPKNCYESWSDWEKELFNQKAEQYSLGSLYKQFDYKI